MIFMLVFATLVLTEGDRTRWHWSTNKECVMQMSDSGFGVHYFSVDWLLACGIFFTLCILIHVSIIWIYLISCICLSLGTAFVLLLFCFCFCSWSWSQNIRDESKTNIPKKQRSLGKYKKVIINIGWWGHRKKCPVLHTARVLSGQGLHVWKTCSLLTVGTAETKILYYSTVIKVK